MKIASNAGHSALSTGASGNGYKEHKVARLINNEFIKQGSARGHSMKNCTSGAATQGLVLNSQIKQTNAFAPAIAVSHHLNAAIASATGVEVFYAAGSAVGKKYATAISAAIAKHYGMRNRGAKSASFQFLRQTKAPAVLIEWGFITNESDISKIMNDIPGGVKAALEAIDGEEDTKPAAKPAPKPVAPAKPKPATKSTYNLARQLKVGYKGDDVKALQKAVGAASDGIFGKNTDNAVRKFQRDNKLKADGIVGALTAKALGWTFKSTPAPSKAAPKPAPKPKVAYYKKYTGKSPSIVTALNAIKVDSSFANRKKIATANGIKNYAGTAEQNTKMLGLLKSGTLKR